MVVQRAVVSLAHANQLPLQILESAVVLESHLSSVLASVVTFDL